MIWDYEIGEDVPCLRCGRLDCAGYCKKIPVVGAITQLTTEPPKMNSAMQEFLDKAPKPPPVPVEDKEIVFDDLRERLRAAGRKGGKKTAERGQEYFKNIRKQRRHYPKRESL